MTDTQDYFFPGGNGSASPDGPQPLIEDDELSASYPKYDALFDAPDFATLIKGTRSTTARDYEVRVKSMLKTVAIGALRKENLTDAATVFEYGPAFSIAAGDLAEKSERTRQAIDLLCAPENPYVAMALIGIPFVAQLFRNRQPRIQQVYRSRRELKKFRKEHPDEFARMYPNAEPPKKNVEVKLPFGRRLSFHVGVKFSPVRALNFMYHVQTHDPDELVNRVFSDPKLIAALKKQRINIVQTPL